MDFDEQLLCYFGTTDLGSVTAEALALGRTRLEQDFQLESDRRQRFAMWAVLHILDSAPDPSAAFKDSEDRIAAARFAASLAQSFDE